MDSVTRRLQQELMGLMMSKDKTCTAFPEGDTLFTWKGSIIGAQGTVYENLSYKLTLKFPKDYPFTAPTVTFDTPCFHPNVDKSGAICLDILKEMWSPSYDVRTILLSIQSMLADPNVDSPLNIQAAQLWADQTKYKVVLKEHYTREVEVKA
eukprot:m.14409 g.14409  ORF g.14409 m.14409 type:complete len:152 (+) comp4304_c0_seq1:264-719(+)